MIPIFHTNYSLRSILNMEPSGKQKPHEAPSIFDCAKDLQLEKLVVVDDIPSAFMPLSDQCDKEGLKLYYGLRFVVCNDIKDKSEDGVSSHACYNIIPRVMSNKLHKNLQAIYIDSGTIGHLDLGKKKYRRIDYSVLKKHWDSDLALIPCFYDGPHYQNLFHFSTHQVNLSEFNPIYELQFHNLPFDNLLADSVKQGNETIKTHSIYYRKKDEFLAFMAYKIASKKRFGRQSSIDAPNIDDFHSNSFCSEALDGGEYDH